MQENFNELMSTGLSFLLPAETTETPPAAPVQASEGVDVGEQKKAPKKRSKKGRTVEAVDEAGELEQHESTVHYCTNAVDLIEQ